MMVRSSELGFLVRSGLIRRKGMAPTPLGDRPDVVLWPDEYTFARRAIPMTGKFGFLDWYPLAGFGRSRLSLSDGWISFGRSY